jgi:hypothetical protein
VPVVSDRITVCRTSTAEHDARYTEPVLLNMTRDTPNQYC